MTTVSKEVQKTIETLHFTIELFTDLTGYFEHNERGDDWAGGLWFDPFKELVDYDGVFELPSEVVNALKLEEYWGDGL